MASTAHLGSPSKQVGYSVGGTGAAVRLQDVREMLIYGMQYARLHDQSVYMEAVSSFGWLIIPPPLPPSLSLLTAHVTARQ